MLTFWLPVATLWQRELVRFWREKSRVLGVVASPLIFWLVIGFGSGADGPKFFQELMAALGSRDGREIVVALDAIRSAGRLDRDAEGRYLLKGPRA